MSPSEFSRDPLPAVTEADAPPRIREVFADIRETLEIDVVNLVWRHLATMPGALEWAWTTVRPLYLERAPARTDQVFQQLVLPKIPSLSTDVMTSSGLNEDASSGIRAILDSYHHTNVLALLCLAAFCARFAEQGGGAYEVPAATLSSPTAAICKRTKVLSPLPPLPALEKIAPDVRRLINELNTFGEDSDTELIASMYRHLSYWPPYLALVRTLLVPLHASGELSALTRAVRRQAEIHGRELAQFLPATAPDVDVGPVVAAVARFVQHPIARMTAICAVLRKVTP